jgi:hypothetical protein
MMTMSESRVREPLCPTVLARLQLAMEQATPDGDGLMTAQRFDVEHNDHVFRVLVTQRH